MYSKYELTVKVLNVKKNSVFDDLRRKIASNMKDITFFKECCMNSNNSISILFGKKLPNILYFM